MAVIVWKRSCGITIRDFHSVIWFYPGENNKIVLIEATFVIYESILVVKPRILRKGTCNHCTSQEHNELKTKKEVSVLDLYDKKQLIIPGKTHAINRAGTENPTHKAT